MFPLTADGFDAALTVGLFLGALVMAMAGAVALSVAEWRVRTAKQPRRIVRWTWN